MKLVQFLTPGNPIWVNPDHVVMVYETSNHDVWLTMSNDETDIRVLGTIGDAVAKLRDPDEYEDEEPVSGG